MKNSWPCNNNTLKIPDSLRIGLYCDNSHPPLDTSFRNRAVDRCAQTSLLGQRERKDFTTNREPGLLSIHVCVRVHQLPFLATQDDCLATFAPQQQQQRNKRIALYRFCSRILTSRCRLTQRKKGTRQPVRAREAESRVLKKGMGKVITLYTNSLI